MENCWWPWVKRTLHTTTTLSRSVFGEAYSARAVYLRHIAAYGEKLLKPDTTDTFGVGASVFSLLSHFPMLHGKRFSATAAASSLFFFLRAASRDWQRRSSACSACSWRSSRRTFSKFRRCSPYSASSSSSVQSLCPLGDGLVHRLKFDAHCCRDGHDRGQLQALV